MKVTIKEQGSIKTENISEHQRLLFRAAYIASFISISSSFPHGRKKDFEQLLKKWPIEIPKVDRNKQTEKLVRDIKEQFESYVYSDVYYFIEHPDDFPLIFKLILKATGLPESEEPLISAWLGKEVKKIYEQKRREEMNRIRNK